LAGNPTNIFYWIGDVKMDKRLPFFLIIIILLIGISFISSCKDRSNTSDSNVHNDPIDLYASLLPDNADIYVTTLTVLSEVLNYGFEQEFETWLEVAGKLLIDDPMLWGRIITDSRLVLVDKASSPESVISARSAILLRKLLSAEENYTKNRFEIITAECNGIISGVNLQSEGVSRYYSVFEILSDSMYEFAGLNEYYAYSVEITELILNSLSSGEFYLLQPDIQDYLDRLFSTASLTVAHYQRMIMKSLRTLIDDLNLLVLENQILQAQEELASIMMKIDDIISTGQEMSLDELGKQASYIMTAIEELPGEPLLQTSDVAIIESKLIGLQTYLNDRMISEQRANLAEMNRMTIENIKKALENKGKNNPSPGSFLAKVDKSSISPEVDQYYWSVFSEIAKGLDSKKMETFVSEILEGRKELQ
jgi:hypothetical protein